MFSALLGDIVLGDQVWTGPVSSRDTRKAAFAEYKVACGKPPRSDHGDDLGQKSLAFFFDETFCEPDVELAKLTLAFDTRQGMALVTGDGTYDGRRWVVEAMETEILKTTPAGRAVRIRVQITLKEDASDLMQALGSAARSAAAGLSGGIATRRA
jgi:hypothetical protein